MDISRVRYFLAVGEHGSFTAAARACGVTQPSVTMGVRRLERAIGGALLERRRPAALTPLGANARPLLQELISIVDRIALLEPEARSHRSEKRAPRPDSVSASAHQDDASTP